MKRFMIGSRVANGVDRKRFEANISVRDWRAAWDWPTDTRPSAWRSTVSGFENGAISSDNKTVSENRGHRRRQRAHRVRLGLVVVSNEISALVYQKFRFTDGKLGQAFSSHVLAVMPAGKWQVDVVNEVLA